MPSQDTKGKRIPAVAKLKTEKQIHRNRVEAQLDNLTEEVNQLRADWREWSTSPRPVDDFTMKRDVMPLIEDARLTYDSLVSMAGPSHMTTAQWSSLIRLLARFAKLAGEGL